MIWGEGCSHALSLRVVCLANACPAGNHQASSPCLNTCGMFQEAGPWGTKGIYRELKDVRVSSSSRSVIGAFLKNFCTKVSAK